MEETLEGFFEEAKFDSISEELKPFYKLSEPDEENNRYYELQLSVLPRNTVPIGNLQESRLLVDNLETENRTLKESLEKFKDINPEEAKEALLKIKQKKLSDDQSEKAIQDLVAKKMQSINEEFEDKEKQYKLTIEQKEKQHKELLNEFIDTQMVNSITNQLNQIEDLELNPGAITPFINEIKPHLGWEMVSNEGYAGRLFIKNEEGKKRYSSTNAANLMTLAEFIVEYSDRVPFFFAGHSGGGAPGSDDSLPEKNPWEKGGSIEERMRIRSKNPALASSLKNKAKIKK